MKNRLAALVATLAVAVAAASPAAPAESPPLSGEVMEFRDAGGYTYLKLRTERGDVWAATSAAPVRKGDYVTLHDAAEMVDFHSRALERTFESIWFGQIAPGTRPAVGMMPAVPKADGPDAFTVAEVVGRRTDLAERKVAIRARVDRVSPNVMGRNWVHLRDGSGSPSEGNYDVVALSTQLPRVGDVVVARGVVRTDVDVGMGHAFKVLVQDATFD